MTTPTTLQAQEYYDCNMERIMVGDYLMVVYHSDPTDRIKVRDINRRGMFLTNHGEPWELITTDEGASKYQIIFED